MTALEYDLLMTLVNDKVGRLILMDGASLDSEQVTLYTRLYGRLAGLRNEQPTAMAHLDRPPVKRVRRTKAQMNAERGATNT